MKSISLAIFLLLSVFTLRSEASCTYGCSEYSLFSKANREFQRATMKPDNESLVGEWRPVGSVWTSYRVGASPNYESKLRDFSQLETLKFSKTGSNQFLEAGTGLKVFRGSLRIDEIVQSDAKSVCWSSGPNSNYDSEDTNCRMTFRRTLLCKTEKSVRNLFYQTQYTEYSKKN